MAIEDINLGTSPTGAGGDTVRAAFGKTNGNFAALLAEMDRRAADLSARETRLARMIETLHGGLPDLDANFAEHSYSVRNADGVVLPVEFSDLFTFARASTKNVFGPDGKLVTVPEGEPAYAYDPVTREPLGIWIEDTATNVLPKNRALDTWLNAGQEVVVTPGETAPDGTPTAFKLAGIGGTSYRLTELLGQATVIGNMYTASFWCYGIADPSVPGNYRIYNPASGNTEFFNDQVVVGEWRFVEIASEATAESTAFQFLMLEGECCKIWFPQFEGGPVATSRILTEADPVTRAADVMTLEDLANADWFNDTMTWVMDLTLAYPSTQAFLLTDGTRDRIFSLIGSNNRYGMYDGDTTTTYEASLTPVAGERRVLAAAYNPLTGEMKICAGGAVVKVPYNGSFGSLNSLSVFTNGAIGTLHSLRAKRGYATDTEMQELTS